MSGDQRYRGFDGLRAIAIVLVIMWHGALATHFPDEVMGPLRPLVMTGWAGVDLFFALSGFLITSLILREERRNEAERGHPTFSLKRFYIRRALRILPVFYAVFLLNTFVLAGHLPSVRADKVLAQGSYLGLWPYATFWGNYFATLVVEHVFVPGTRLHLVDPGEAYSVFWSLCVEEHFYLVWPFVLTLVKRWRVRVGLALAVCVLMALARFVARATQFNSHQALQVVSHFRMDSILWGALGALVVDRLPAAALPRRLVLLALLALLSVLYWTRHLSVLPPPTALGISLGLTLLASFSTVLLIELVKAPDSRLAAVLDARPLVIVGQLSYAMYLIHMQAIDLGRMVFFATPRQPTLANLLLAFGLFVILATLAAALLHILIERPFLRLKDRFSARAG